MHFWIDKRSQTYGFGRARVAASLSGAGGNGLGFPHPPRRMGGKTSSMPTIHRLPPQQQQHSHSHGHHQQQQQQHQQQSTTIDCHRSHSISNNNNNNAHSSNHSHNNNNHHLSNNSSSHVANNNNNNNYSNSSGSGTIVHYTTNRTNRGCRSSSSLNNATLNNNNHHEAGATTMTTTTTRTYHHHPQFGNMSIRHYQTQQTAATGADHSPYATRVHHHHHHNPTQRLQSMASPASTMTSIALPPIYVSPSHPQNLEEGAMGIGPISTVRLHQSNTTGTVTTTTSNSTASNSMIGSADAQVVPSHLKFGMWITLIMASIFIAGAKLYADHQGTGLEVLIFAAFSATFFLAACTVSLCRLPSSLAASPSLSIDDSSRGLLNQQNNQLNLHYQPSAQQQQRENLELTPTGAPPPYHIAILLPENGKEPPFKDESPPPSYDKIVI